VIKNWSGTLSQIQVPQHLCEIAGLQNIPSLSDVVQVYGQQTALMLIGNHLVSLCAFTDNELKPIQFFDTAMLISSEYYYLNLSELCLFFRRCKIGFYGQLVWGKKLNIQQVMAALQQFKTERAQVLIQSESQKQTSTVNIKQRSVLILRGIDQVRALSQQAKTSYKAFRQIYPLVPNDHDPQVYWRAWRILGRPIGELLYRYNKQMDGQMM